MPRHKRRTYNIYVIELDQKVWSERKKFRTANPHFKGKLECLYVGMTSNTPEVRFHKHKTGHRNRKGIKVSSAIVEKFGICLRPSLYERFNPMDKEKAIRMEKELAESLRKRGYAVWWN